MLNVSVMFEFAGFNFGNVMFNLYSEEERAMNRECGGGG